MVAYRLMASVPRAKSEIPHSKSEMPHSSSIKAVVFDLDGLMFNTEDIFNEVGRLVLARRGKEMTRELLQQNPLLEQIRKNLVKRILDALEDMKNSEYEKYVAFFKELGAVLKEGVSRDWTNRQKVADLLLFESMKTEKGKYLTLQQYVDAMPAEQFMKLHGAMRALRPLREGTP